MQRVWERGLKVDRREWKQERERVEGGEVAALEELWWVRARKGLGDRGR